MRIYSDWMESNSVVIQNTAPVLSSVTIDQDEVYFEDDATYRTKHLISMATN